MKACRLTSLPDRRRTFDRRLSTISVEIKERTSTMGNLFVKKKLVDPYIVTIDSTLLELANIGGRFFALNIYFSSDEISDDIPMSIRQLLPSQSPVHIDVMATISQSPSNL